MMLRLPPPWLVAAAIALAARLTVIVVSQLTDPYALRGDALLYDLLARALLDGRGLERDGAPTAVVGPGYPVFVAAVYALTGGSVLGVGLAQAVVGAAGAALAALLAARIAGATAAYLAGLIVALYPHFLVWTQQVLTETVFLAASLGALVSLVEAARRRDPRWALVAGLALGAAALTRSEAAAFVPVAAVLLWATARDRRGAVVAAAFAVASVAVLVPWVARNVSVVGVAALSTGAGSVLWLGHSPNAAANHRDGYVFGDPLPTPVTQPISEGESYRTYLAAVGAFLREEPLSPLASLPAKAWNMVRPTFGGARLVTWMTLGAAWIALVILSAVGAWRGGLRREAAFIWAFALTLTAVHLGTIAEIRYRMAIEAALAVPAAAGAVALVRFARGTALRA